MKPALKLPVILGSAAALAAAALLLGKPAPTAAPPSPPPTNVVVAPPRAPVPVAQVVLPSSESPIAPAKGEGPVIQIALLLDTSGSMDGLLDQARTQLWNIVNRFSKAKRDGVSPELQLALYAYGNGDPGAGSNEIRLVSPFTTDLDALSERLFALRTSGGTELAGEVIDEAVKKLAWSRHPDAMRLIFIAGNEDFDQGTVDFRKTTANARKEGITVNTIHCGGFETGISHHWKEGSTLGGGSYMNIDQDAKVVELPAPQDEEIARLGAELNKTYVAYGGAKGAVLQQRQAVQDSNSLKSSLGAMVSRSMAKASHNYSNANWDLVDAVKQKQVDLGAMPAEELPEPLRGLDAAGRKAWLEAREAERAKLQARIQELANERQRFLTEARRNQADTGNTLDGAIGQVVANEAKKRNLTLE
ncbi:VWA domain-containing protein [Myxococcus sp. K15C18031901]|uniref:vWA domain-containing protein n=1 Tax=Myxococcus dinghuensis TaxID=2906761 RepID=UPI0020A81DBD|nr:vWA domain-containing protein [Myxococcus dinghuensis]MCP3099978.1 VWA domain-containing protein [Myxococcus dinghuensis]